MSYTNGLDDPTLYFNTKLYTGNGGTQSITGVGFQPDWTWIKVRSTTYNHRAYDVVRGVDGNYGKLFPNLTNAENTIQTNEVTSLDSDGFTLGNSVNVNNNGSTFVSWNWLANNTSGSSNTDGSITSTVSANTTSGFSIVSYTGNGSASTVGHGLGSAPKMIIVKSRSGVGEWITWHTGINIQAKLSLNTSDAVYNPGTGIYWNSTLPTSSVFSVGTSGSSNGNGTTYIAYCFAEKKGFSKFGSYTGNGSTDGTFIYTGFKPAYVMFKEISNINAWRIQDNKREPFNVVNNTIFANVSNAESTTGSHNNDFLSNGIKLRDSDTNMNRSGGTFIYMAFAENPFVTSTGIPTVAR